MIFIFIGSTDLLSAAHTSRFIGPFLRWFAPNVSEAAIASIQLVVRKCGHLTEYAILAALLFRAFRQSRMPVHRIFVISFGVAAAYAAVDEFHQSFVPSRTSSALDVLVDCAGALVGLGLYMKVIGNRESKIENQK